MQRLATPVTLTPTGHLSRNQRVALERRGYVKIARGFMAAPPPDGPDWERNAYLFEATLRAAAATTHGPLVFTGIAAAFLHRAPLLAPPPSIDAYVFADSRKTRRIGPAGAFALRLHHPPFPLSGPKKHASLLTTESALCAMDLARFGPRAETVHISSYLATVRGLRGAPRTAANVARWRRETALLRERAIALCERLPRSAGPKRSARILAGANGMCESIAEARFWSFVLKWGLPEPALQVPITTPEGTKWADAAWERQKVVVEIDGELKFAGPDANWRIRRERRRDNALRETGWQVLHVSWRDLDNPFALKARISRALSASW